MEDLAEEAGQAIINAQSEPLIVTENGRPKVYLISVDLFDSLVAQLELIEDAELRAYVAASERQFAQGAYKTLADYLPLSGR